jgi:hypothetical protein
MMKFFRKYMKHFLVAGTVFLMIVFVGGSALTSMCDPSYARETEQIVRGTAFGEEVTFGDMQYSFVHANILARVVPSWDFPWVHLFLGMGMNMDNLQMLVYQGQLRREPLSEDEWFMLLLASGSDDSYVSDQQIAEYKEGFQLTPERLAAIRDNLKVSTTQIDRAIAAYARVLADANQVVSAVVASEADIQGIVRQTEQKINVDALIIASDNFLDESYEPTPEEIQSHYGEYKNQPAPAAPTGVLFGYQSPEEVKVEYIRIDADALIDRQAVSDDEAFEFWEKPENRNQFFKPQTQPAPGEKPAPREPYMTFAEARQEVMARLKKEKARREAISVARDLILRLSAPWADRPATQPSGFKEIPAEARSAEVYPELVESLRNPYPDALSFVRKDFMTIQELYADADLSQASAGSGRSRAVLAQAAFYVPGTGMSPERAPDEQKLFFHNLYETVREPFVGSSGEHEGDVFVARTVAVRPPLAPPLDDIRDQIITDVRKKRAYERAEKGAKDLAARLDKDTRLRDAFLADELLSAKLPKTAFLEPDPFALKRIGGQMMPQLEPNYVRELGFDRSLTDALRPLVETHQADGTHPAIAYEQKNQGRWLVIQIDGILPVTTKTYEDNRDAAMDYVRLNMMLEVVNRWFDPEQIRARVQWKDAADEGEKASEEGPDAEDSPAQPTETEDAA